ncbi:MAG: type II secretion system protein, partial [Planctomycetota bacterium]|nr:type II secretion system protein [Planctomycetota bacterium]
MSNCRLRPARICPGNQRQGLTLIELLVVLGIIVTIAGMLLFMLNGAREESRRLRTVAQVRRVNQVVAERWEEVGFQPVQLNEASRNVVANALPAAKLGLSRNLKLSATRELQRLEFPDRISDLAVFPQFGAPTPAWLNYRLKVQVVFGTTDWTEILTSWSDDYEGAECLYLILSAIFDEDGHALRFFSQNEIGDIDDDGMPEIW